MKTLATGIPFCVLALLDLGGLDGIALAEPSPPAEAVKVRFTLREAKDIRVFDVMVDPSNRCAAVGQKAAGREVEVHTCLVKDSRLEVSWRTRSSQGEYHSTSTVSAAPGTTELGSASGPRLTVTIL